MGDTAVVFYSAVLLPILYGSIAALTIYAGFRCIFDICIIVFFFKFFIQFVFCSYYKYKQHKRQEHREKVHQMIDSICGKLIKKCLYFVSRKYFF